MKFEQETLKHHIQRSIVGYLLGHEYARFSDMKPPRTDSNLYSYHLKLLLKAEIVKKTESGYTLSQKGLAFVDRVNAEKIQIRTQPKIITMLLVQDGYGKVLMQKRSKQPYINEWTLPYGKLHIDDKTLESAACREAKEKLDYECSNIRHAGDCYIRVHGEDGLLSTTLAHIFRFEADDIPESETLRWVKPLELTKLRLAPAVAQIVARSFFNDAHFFEEYDVEYSSLNK